MACRSAALSVKIVLSAHFRLIAMIRTLFRATVAAALLGAGLPASGATGEAAAPAWEGVWSGTIGTLPIHACLRDKDGEAAGVYYYDKHLLPIHLTTPAQGGSAALALSEGRQADGKQAPPQWTLALPVGGQMNGTWAGAGKQLPIHLKLVLQQKSDDDEGPCASAEFNAPREVPARLVTSSASLDGASYRVLTLDFGARFNGSVNSIQLPGAANARVNAQLREALMGEQANVYDCSRNSLGQYGEDGEYSDQTTPQAITAQWLVTEHSNGNSCGGIHPNASTTHETWNLITGKKVDTWDWFSPAGASRGTHEADAPLQISDRLSRLLNKAWTDSVADDCKDASSGYWTPYPTKHGMAFTPSLPHVVYACTTDVVIPYAKLAPLLNAQGKLALASFRAAARSK